ncbi:Glycosyltransferase [Archaeoglobus sulfaticallidus PM70-1]|uniref:Glycosyltransferase n=1 Tax=Archaeoglobus sulfaticallidus PM70-1 TaxID=387631 RepID=N0BAQ2_9EURY|nr:glycosyltransferase [Archaeoglobus sulfaticallidus]AGK60068.1 Glycosyltransferase [Archaeoglobus sulfaticallidus PM70-1]
MKILQVIPYFVPAWGYGGPVRVAYELSKRLVEKGHEVTVYTTDTLSKDSRVNKKVQEIDGIRVQYFPNLSNKLAWNHNIFLSPSMISIVKKRIQNFDIIHMHEYRTFQNIVVYNYAKKYGVPYVLQAHGSLPRMIAKQNLKKLFDFTWGYKILNDASKVIAVSKAEVKQYKHMGISKNKIVTIPNGLDVDKFKVLPENRKFKEKFHINKRIILFLGRIHKRKGIDFLIKSFFRLNIEKKDVVLVIAGPDDGHKDKLIELVNRLKISNSVYFVGYLDDNLSAYVDAEVLVYPSIHEIFGLVPFEAIMCGTPVIATDDCGCGEIIKETNCGFLVRYGNENDLKEKIKILLEKPEIGEKMVKKGKRYIVENLAWNKVAKKMEKVYESCIISLHNS